MRQVKMSVFLFMLFTALAGCALEPITNLPVKSEPGDQAPVTSAEQAADGSDCPVTDPTIATPPDSAHRDPLPHGAYFVSADEKLWVRASEWRQGREKYPWVKPLNSQLVIQGRRLDGEAPPLWADIAPGYSRDFQPSTIIIPTAGCWEIEARANTSVLRFVVYIAPQPEPAQDLDCAQFGEVVKPDKAIVVGRIEKRALDASGRWAWLTVRVMDNLYPRSFYASAVMVGIGLTVLQDAEREPLLAQGNDNLLVLRGVPWQIACPLQTVVGVDFAQDPARVKPSAVQTLWSGKTVAEIEAEIMTAQQR